MLTKVAKKDCLSLKKYIEEMLKTPGLEKGDKNYLTQKLMRIEAGIKEMDRLEKACEESER